VVIAIAGGLFTYWYNLLSANRERKAMLSQKKAEFVLSLSPHYKQIMRNMLIVAHLLEHYRHSEVIDNDTYRRCFYSLAVYIRERNVLRNEPASYFLADPAEEGMLAVVEASIISRLQNVFGPRGYDELQYILLPLKTIRDFRIEGENRILFDNFKDWLNHGGEDIDEFVYDLKLYSYILSYAFAKIFKDWYPRKEKVDERISELTEQINSMLWKDDRYRSVGSLE
jgi:hypothetical protein